MPSASSPETFAQTVIERLAALPKRDRRRRLVAIAGAPASGKSTVAALVAERLGEKAALLPMDGFHLDNTILDARGLRGRRGSPETFDLPGLQSLLRRLQTEDDLYGPSFDRSRDLSVGSSRHFGPEVETVIVEGNYLLLDQPGWRDLAQLWDLSVWIEVPQPELRQRLLARWHGYGFSDTEAEAKVDGNDLPNARTVQDHLLPADLVLGA